MPAQSLIPDTGPCQSYITGNAICYKQMAANCLEGIVKLEATHILIGCSYHMVILSAFWISCCYFHVLYRLMVQIAK